jgi:hypothetical protein
MVEIKNCRLWLCKYGVVLMEKRVLGTATLDAVDCTKGFTHGHCVISSMMCVWQLFSV